MLSHKSGVTVQLFDFIVSMVECGNLFSTIEDKLRENKQNFMVTASRISTKSISPSVTT